MTTRQAELHPPRSGLLPESAGLDRLDIGKHRSASGLPGYRRISQACNARQNIRSPRSAMAPTGMRMDVKLPETAQAIEPTRTDSNGTALTTEASLPARRSAAAYQHCVKGHSVDICRAHRETSEKSPVAARGSSLTGKSSPIRWASRRSSSSGRRFPHSHRSGIWQGITSSQFIQMLPISTSSSV